MTQIKQILFIGDSITDAGRQEDPEQIGTGYVRVINDYLKVTYPNEQLNILNKGNGGDRVTDLVSRWQTDVIALDPDIISISIGINDVWRQLDQLEVDQVYPEQFEQVYNNLLAQVKEKTTAQIILMEPTVIEEDIQSEGNKKLIPYVEIVHKLAVKYQAIIVPTHEVFMYYLKTASDYKLTTDGVHMNTAGDMLMAKTWLSKTKDLFEE